MLKEIESILYKVGVIPTFFIVTTVLSTSTYYVAENYNAKIEKEKQQEIKIAEQRIKDAESNLTGIMEADKAGNYNIGYGDIYSTKKNAENLTQAFNMEVIVTADKELNTFKTGEPQVVTYTLTSEIDPETIVEKTKSIKYNIIDCQKPIIKFKAGDSFTLKEGDKFSEDKIGIECSDPVDGKLEKVKNLDENSKDWKGGYTVETDWKDGNKAGNYSFTVVAKDINGNVEKKVFKIKVNPSETAVANNQSAEQSSSASQDYYQSAQQVSEHAQSQNPSVQQQSPVAPQQRACQMNEICIGSSYHAILYQSGSESNSVNQPIVDAENSAVLMNYLGRSMIADHASQGFNAICYESSGYVYGTPIYCGARLHGTNTGNGILLDDGNYADEEYPGSYILYTCNDSAGVDVTVTFWYNA